MTLGLRETVEGVPKADWSLLDPQSVLPQQLIACRPQTGEQRLLLALVEDAVRMALLPPSQGAQNAERLDALEWIRFRSSRLYGFRFACEHLGLDADALADRIATLQPQRIAFNRTTTGTRQKTSGEALLGIGRRWTEGRWRSNQKLGALHPWKRLTLRRTRPT